MNTVEFRGRLSKVGANSQKGDSYGRYGLETKGGKGEGRDHTMMGVNVAPQSTSNIHDLTTPPKRRDNPSQKEGSGESC